MVYDVTNEVREAGIGAGSSVVGVSRPEFWRDMQASLLPDCGLTHVMRLICWVVAGSITGVFRAHPGLAERGEPLRERGHVQAVGREQE